MTKKTTKKSDVITIEKDALWKYGALVLLGIVVILLLVLFMGGNTAQPQAQQQQQGQVPNVELNAGDAPTMGSADAPVTIIEYHDFQCGFCGRHHTETYPMIKQQFIDAGLVKYVKKDFVSVGNSQTQEAAHCARDQGGDEAYFHMTDIMYANQAQLRGGVSGLTSLAGQAGLDTAAFEECLTTGKFASVVAANTAEGRAAGVTGTPGFFINGVQVVGAQPFSVFQQTINAQLS